MGSAPVEARAIRISQVCTIGGSDCVFPGGGGCFFDSDYVELFNASGVPVDLSGWVVAYDYHQAYQATTKPFICDGCTGTIPAGTMIQPCSYLLIALGPPAPPGGGSPLPITPDLRLAAPSLYGCWFGSIALLAGGAPDSTCAPPTLEDLVGWNGDGTGTTLIRCFLGTAAGAFCWAVLVRRGAGLTDTSNNAEDFHYATPSEIVLHNSASPANPACNGVPTLPSSWGHLKDVYR
jgi:hypothetical protein